MARAPIEIMNNFQKLKSEFKTDTGLEANEQNMGLYIQYFNAIMNDKTYQVVHGLTHQLINKLDSLPNDIRLEMADMIKTHDTIKQLLKNKS